MRDVPLAQVAEYACEDADITLQLHEALWEQLHLFFYLSRIYIEKGNHDKARDYLSLAATLENRKQLPATIAQPLRVSSPREKHTAETTT